MDYFGQHVDNRFQQRVIALKALLALFLLVGLHANAQVGLGGASGPPITNPVDQLTASTTVATSYTVNPLTAPSQRLTLTNSPTLTFVTPTTAGVTRSFTLTLVQGGAGSNVVTWPSNVKWSGAASPTLSTSPSAVDIVTFMSIDQATWYGFLNGVDVR